MFTDDKDELFNEINNWKFVKSNVVPLCGYLYSITWENGHIKIVKVEGEIYFYIKDDKKTGFYKLTKGDISFFRKFPI
jgi:hypothetical protein